MTNTGDTIFGPLPNITGYPCLDLHSPPQQIVHAQTQEQKSPPRMQVASVPGPACGAMTDSGASTICESNAAVSPAPQGVSCQLCPVSVESWRLGLTKSDIVEVFWTQPAAAKRGSKSYLYPDTQEGELFRMGRIAAKCNTVPKAEYLMEWCRLYSVDQAQDLSHLVGRDRPWLAALPGSRAHHYYCASCSPRLPRCNDTGVLEHVALTCLTDVQLHERSSLHKSMATGGGVTSDPVALQLAACVCDTIRDMTAAVRRLKPAHDTVRSGAGSRARKKPRV
jgi:hypothetical protein